VCVCLSSENTLDMQKYLTKIYLCLRSKIPHEKKTQKKTKTNKNKKYIFRLKSQHAFEKN